jgi:hypothetical protein
MDSDDVFMIQGIKEDEANVTSDEEEHLKITTCLLHLQTKLDAAPGHGGS